MPELPDINLYVDHLRSRINGQTLQHIDVRTPFLVRSFDPPLTASHGLKVRELRRIGKRIAIGLERELWLVLHLMVAGRLLWYASPPNKTTRNQLASFIFSSGALLLTEAGSKKRASLFLVRGAAGLRQHDPGGLEPLECGHDEFRRRLTQENRTLKRALTDPRKFSGIGNAYSDEILHAAQLSPIQHTQKLLEVELERLYSAMQSVLTEWSERLKIESGSHFPTKVTAFRDDMAVHGKFGRPCPRCASPVQRIRYKSNETNYCATCQTGGKILADRSLSRLLKDNWPRSLEE